jgi:hypothetical protein
MTAQTKMPAPTDVAGWNAFTLETLHALQVEHEELFADLTSCVQPGASPALARTLLPKTIMFMGAYLELLAIANAVQFSVINSEGTKQ